MGRDVSTGWGGFRTRRRVLCNEFRVPTWQSHIFYPDHIETHGTNSSSPSHLNASQSFGMGIGGGPTGNNGSSSSKNKPATKGFQLPKIPDHYQSPRGANKMMDSDEEGSALGDFTFGTAGPPMAGAPPKSPRFQPSLEDTAEAPREGMESVGVVCRTTFSSRSSVE